ncbi:hypothetical protein WN53_12455 [Serratia fonticola]|uniref:roadblock/LC7 domain-containing protein n=1 Tax=Serratia fonticola TaxID=47917 RepID=UPI0004033F34|nr:roadblock/LC7 domain-containing protein [Serratia fonticola]AKG69857.1 hypothetical protein WN53_12455 [Serratia fonticola]CAI1636406.1 Uncharacterised protein [Serratia fonticola]
MKKNLLQQQIETLSENISTKNTVIICSNDGDLIVQTDHGIEVDLNRVAVQAATVFGVSSRMGSSLNLGVSSELTIAGKFGRIFIFRLNDNFFLGVVSPRECNIAMLNIVALRAVKAIQDEDLL